MKFEKLECVVLAHDILAQGLRAGDLGTIVDVYSGDGYEIEFVRGSGATQALLTLSGKDIRKMDSLDLPTTRRLAEVK